MPVLFRQIAQKGMTAAAAGAEQPWCFEESLDIAFEWPTSDEILGLSPEAPQIPSDNES